MSVGVRVTTVEVSLSYLKDFMTVEGNISLNGFISQKNIYIIKRIIISTGEQLQKKEIQQLYKDAIYQHLLKEGYSEYQAEAKARRRMMRDDTL